MTADATVLYVDPSPADREAVAAAFADSKATLSAVADRDAAVAAMDGTDVDCVVSEAELSDASGLELLDAVDSPFVFYTDDGDESFAGRAVARGAAGYVPKADGAATLVDRVEDLLVGDGVPRTAAVEAELREERSRFAALFESVPDPIATIRKRDGGAVVVDVNAAFESVFGYDADQIVDASVADYLVPPEERDHHRELVERSLDGETIEGEEVTRRTVDGLREFLLTVVPVEGDESDADRYVVYTDITERKQRRKRVEVLNRVLRHDLRNGMNIVRGYAETLRGEVPEDLTQAVDAIEARATELLEMAEKTRLVEQTLGEGRDAAGPVEVGEATAAAAERVRDEHPESTIDVSSPDGIRASASSLLQTAIYHVVENAVVHNDADEPSVCVSVRRAGDDVVIEVRDDGPGIPRAERELLFEDREITQLRHASGLGLWLVNWVVEQSGGTISFGENEPRGSVVTLRVPRARTEAVQAGTEESDA